MIEPNRISQNASARDLHGGVSLRALLAVLRRRKVLLAAVAVPVLVAFVAAAYLLPPRYRAETLLEFEPVFDPGHDHATIPHELTAEHQLPRITELVYRPALLERAVREADLLPEGGERVPRPVLNDVKSRIDIRVVGERNFTLGFEDGDPERVARLASLLAEGLIGTTRGERERRAEETSEFIAAQLEPVAARLEQQERAIEAYKQANVHEIPDHLHTTLELLEGTQERMQAISASVADAKARRAAIQREMTELERQGVSSRPARSPAEVRLEELRMDLRQLERRYTEEHPEVRRARAEIEELEQAIAEGTLPTTAAPEPSPLQLRYLQLKAELEAAEGRVAAARAERSSLLAERSAYQGRIHAAPRHEAEVAAMKREYEVTQEQHHALLAQLQEARRAEDLEKTSQAAVFRILEPARVPASPSFPNRTRLILMGLVVALALGLGAAFVAEQVDPTFRGVDEVESALGLPVLAAVPPVPRKMLSRKRERSWEVRPELALLDAPEDVAAEQYRILATRLTRHTGPSRPAVVMVTSPLLGEGKTTTALNLGLALARQGDDKVLVVDADVGRPAVHRFLGIPRGNGLEKLLTHPEEDPLRLARWHRGLWLLEGGHPSPEVRSLLSSPQAERVFQRLRQSFRYVIIDTPPVLAAAEGFALQQVADAVLVVVRARKTPRDAVRRALGGLDPARVVGAVLTGADAKSAYVYPYPYHEAHREPAGALAGGPQP